MFKQMDKKIIMFLRPEKFAYLFLCGSDMFYYKLVLQVKVIGIRPMRSQRLFSVNVSILTLCMLGNFA